MNYIITISIESPPLNSELHLLVTILWFCLQKGIFAIPSIFTKTGGGVSKEVCMMITTTAQ